MHDHAEGSISQFKAAGAAAPRDKQVPHLLLPFRLFQQITPPTRIAPRNYGILRRAGDARHAPAMCQLLLSSEIDCACTKRDTASDPTPTISKTARAAG